MSNKRGIIGECMMDFEKLREMAELTIKGIEKKQDEEDKDTKYIRNERNFGTFQRSFTLSTQVQSDKVKATYNDGILTITIPKKEEVKPKEIPITIE